ncbi:hypothetical protein CRYUN_Cryun03dG0175700 [Craigia yunnanensis]
MEGKNKSIQQEIPASAWPKNTSDASPFSFMSPSNLPLAPSPFHVRQKPYFMNHVGAGASSSSGTKKGENNNKTDQNPSEQYLTLETSASDNSVKSEVGNGIQVHRGLDTSMDPRKLKRIASNRVSAQKSRIKKLQYVCDMERKAESLETLIAVLSSQVALQKDKKYLLQMEKTDMNQRMTACANRRIIVDAEIEQRKAEVNRFRQLQLIQQQQKMQAQTSWAGWEHGLTEQIMNPCLNQTMYFNPNQVGAGENRAEINRLNQLNLQQQQEKPGQILMPGWEQGRGQMTNMGFDQSGSWQVQNPSLNQSKQLRNGSFNPNLAGLEQILNFNPENHYPRNDFI